MKAQSAAGAGEGARPQDVTEFGKAEAPQGNGEGKPLQADPWDARALSVELAGTAESLCRKLLPAGVKQGSEWRCGSVQGEAGKSLSVRLNDDKAGVWSDFATGESGDALELVKANRGYDTREAIRWAKRWLGIDEAADAPAPRPRPVCKPNRHDANAVKRTEAALAILRASRPAPGSPVEAYHRGRSVTIPIPPTLRFHPNVRYGGSGLSLPCMVAAVQAPDRKVTAIHRTYIRDDGQGKAGVSTTKKALGPIGAGAVRLGPTQPALGVCEGIETGLSAIELFGISCWAALGSRMDRVELPEQVVEVQIFGDNGGRGHEAAERAAKVYQAQGRRVFLRFPPANYGDWNDFLQGRKTEAA